MRAYLLVFGLLALGVVSARAEPAAAPPPSPDTLPPVQELFQESRARDYASARLRAAGPAGPSASGWNWRRYPSDAAVFRFENPLLTPETPVFRNLVDVARPAVSPSPAGPLKAAPVTTAP